VASVCSLILLLASTRSWTVRIALALTLGLLALGTALTLITIWVETAWEYDWLTRVNGIVWILAALGVVVVPLSSLLLKTGSKPTAATQEGTAPHASATQSIASPGPSAASLHRLEAAARAEGITADELLDRLLETDGRPPSEPADLKPARQRRRSHRCTSYPQPWVPAGSRARITEIAEDRLGAGTTMAETVAGIESLIAASDRLHDEEAFNLNPASNVLNPRAAALLASGAGPRTSLGYAGAKYEMGLEHIEQVEVVTAELAARVFNASFAEVRVPSGAMANLFAFMATSRRGQTIIASPETIGGHITHHAAGAAGLYGLTTVEAPVDSGAYSCDLDALAALAREVRPSLITMGGSLNLFEHPVAKVREIADEVGARLLFDAAHVCGMIAGRQWANPLDEGAHLMSMSTYKSLGGPSHGLLLSNDDRLSERIDAIAFPGMTANFDAGAVAALGVTPGRLDRLR
jgi:hypothetical protein